MFGRGFYSNIWIYSLSGLASSYWWNPRATAGCEEGLDWWFDWWFGNVVQLTAPM